VFAEYLKFLKTNDFPESTRKPSDKFGSFDSSQCRQIFLWRFTCCSQKRRGETDGAKKPGV